MFLSTLLSLLLAFTIYPVSQAAPSALVPRADPKQVWARLEITVSLTPPGNGYNNLAATFKVFNTADNTMYGETGVQLADNCASSGTPFTAPSIQQGTTPWTLMYDFIDIVFRCPTGDGDPIAVSFKYADQNPTVNVNQQAGGWPGVKTPYSMKVWIWQ